MLCHLPYSGQVSYFPAKHGPCFPSANSGVRCLHMTGPVGYVTLNPPRGINPVNVQMRDDLYQAKSAARDDPDISVIILKGAERGFCSGADVSEFGTAPSPIIARQVRWERDQWGLILGIPKPIIVAIHGYAIGAGIEMSLCCALRIASEETRFGLPEAALGMIPAAGGSQKIGRGH